MDAVYNWKSLHDSLLENSFKMVVTAVQGMMLNLESYDELIDKCPQLCSDALKHKNGV